MLVTCDKGHSSLQCCHLKYCCVVCRVKGTWLLCKKGWCYDLWGESLITAAKLNNRSQHHLNSFYLQQRSCLLSLFMLVILISYRWTGECFRRHLLNSFWEKTTLFELICRQSLTFILGITAVCRPPSSKRKLIGAKTKEFWTEFNQVWQVKPHRSI